MNVPFALKELASYWRSLEQSAEKVKWTCAREDGRSATAPLRRRALLLLLSRTAHINAKEDETHQVPAYYEFQRQFQRADKSLLCST